MLCFLFFKQKTAYEMRIRDWSSDVCSSDLADIGLERVAAERNIVGDIRHHGELAQLSDGAVGRADRGAVNVNAVQIIDADNVEFAKTFDNIGEVLGRDRGAVQALERDALHLVALIGQFEA